MVHAIGESILGALALGDLGKHFPDTDDTYKGMDSMNMLKEIYNMMIAKGYVIGNLDALIMIERPKMAPHIATMRANIAQALCCDIEQVSIKATRGGKRWVLSDVRKVFWHSAFACYKKVKMRECCD